MGKMGRWGDGEMGRWGDGGDGEDGEDGGENVILKSGQLRIGIFSITSRSSPLPYALVI